MRGRILRFDLSVRSQGLSELLQTTREELKGESEVPVIPEILWIGHALRRVEHARDEARIGVVRAHESAGQRLGTESHGNRRARATHCDLPIRDSPLSKMERAPKFFHIGDVLGHPLRRDVEVEGLRPPGVSRGPGRNEDDAHGATHESEPFNARTPGAAEHADEGVQQGFRRGAHVRVDELGGVTSQDHELQTAKGRGNREMSKIRKEFQLPRAASQW